MRGAEAGREGGGLFVVPECPGVLFLLSRTSFVAARSISFDMRIMQHSKEKSGIHPPLRLEGRGESLQYS